MTTNHAVFNWFEYFWLWTAYVLSQADKWLTADNQWHLANMADISLHYL